MKVLQNVARHVSPEDDANNTHRRKARKQTHRKIIHGGLAAPYIYIYNTWGLWPPPIFYAAAACKFCPSEMRAENKKNTQKKGASVLHLDHHHYRQKNMRTPGSSSLSRKKHANTINPSRTKLLLGSLTRSIRLSLPIPWRCVIRMSAQMPPKTGQYGYLDW